MASTPPPFHLDVTDQVTIDRAASFITKPTEN